MRHNNKFFEYQVWINFDERNPNEVLRVLGTFGFTFHRLDIGEKEAYVMQPFFLKEVALSKDRAGASALFGIENWPTAINWFLRTYATSQSIQETVDNLRQIKQGTEEKYMT